MYDSPILSPALDRKRILKDRNPVQLSHESPVRSWRSLSSSKSVLRPRPPDSNSDSTYRNVFVYAAIAGMALACGIAVFSYMTLAALQVPFTSEPTLFTDLMSKWGGVVQGTVGIAVALAGVLVTIRIANSALEAAQSALFIAREEQRRESERYAREVKVEVYRFARDFEEAFGALHQYFNSIIFFVPRDVFFARSVAIDYDFLADPDRSPDSIRQHAVKVAEVLVTASTCSDEMSLLSDEDKTSYKLSANEIYAALARCENPHSFVDVSGVADSMQDLRTGLKPHLLRLKDLIAEIDGNGLICDLIYSDRDAEQGLNWLRHRVDDLLVVINDADRLLDRFGRASVVTELSLQGGHFGYGTNLAFNDAFGFPALFSFFEQSTADAFNSHADGLIGVSRAANGFFALLRVFSSDKKQIANMFALNATDDDDFIPRSLRSYRPPSKLANWTDRVEVYLPLIRRNELARQSELGEIDDIPGRQVERSLAYWKGLCDTRLFRRGAVQSS